MVATNSSLQRFLQNVGAAPKKSLSQNFLIDGNIVSKIVKAASLEKGECVLEIGAGPGALTEALLETGCKVIAVEKDDKFAKELKRFENLEVFHGDIRDFPFETITKAKVVANLPYHLTAPIIALLFEHFHRFTSLTIMVQEEVARRIVAQAGTSDYSHFSLFVNFYSHPRYCFHVSNRCFFPVPKVQSAVVTLEIKKALPDVDKEGFFKFSKRAFHQKRKMLRSSLKSSFLPAKIEQALQELGKIGTERPETLTLTEWLALYEKSLYF